MPITLNDAIRRVRSAVDEPAIPTLANPPLTNPPQPRFYTDTEITDWINDGLRDVSRRAEDLITFDATIVINPYIPVPGQSAPTYPLQNDVIRIQRIEFVPTGAINQTYPLIASTQQQMDQVWGTYQQNPASYPQFWVTRGYPGGSGRNAFVLQIYPVPSQGGTLQLFYYRNPTRIPDPVAAPSNYLVTLDIVEGWDDAVVEFATYKALQKARNPEWQERKKEYEEKVNQMIDVTRSWTDQPSYVSYGTRFMPSWLTEWDS
jgi:hypothetical protein